MAKRSILTPQPDPDDIADLRHELQSAVYDAISQDDVRDIVRGMVKRAKDGDHKAASIVLGQLVGTPRAAAANVTQQVAIVAQPSDGGPCRLPPGPNVHRIVDEDSTPPAELARRRKAGG